MRQPKRVVGKIEWEKRDQPYESDETPTLCIDSVNQPLRQTACLATDPLSRDVPRSKECKGRTECGSS